MMASMGDGAIWTRVVERVRQGGKLSDALGDVEHYPPWPCECCDWVKKRAQLPLLAGRVAEFYETKLQRSLDRMVGLIGPLAIVTISIIVGGLIVSVMTSLLSVSQLVG